MSDLSPSTNRSWFSGFRCHRCVDSGLWVSPKGLVEECPGITLGLAHPEPNEASVMLGRSVRDLKQRGLPVDLQTFEIARALTRFSSSSPCSRTALLDAFFSYLPMQEKNRIRKLQAVVEDLRRVWLMPIGSRKDSPAGYWIITDSEDFQAWVERSKRAPIAQLTTIHKVAKKNFPVFAEQLEIEFFNNVDGDLPSAA